MNIERFGEFSSGFWVFVFANFMSYATMGPLATNFSQILRVRFGLDMLETGVLLGYIAIVLTILGPLIGIASDYVNKRMLALAASNLILFVVQMYFYVSPKEQTGLYAVLPIGLFEFAIGIYFANLQAALK